MPMTKELTIKKEISPIVNKVGLLVIKNSKDMSGATAILSQLNKFLDKLTEEKEKLTKPINTALKEIRTRYKPVEDEISIAISTLKIKMVDYQTEAKKQSDLETTKIADKMLSGKMKMETAMKKMSEIDAPDSKVKTEDGSVSFREVKKFEVMDMSMLPIEYILPNETLIRKAMLEGVEIPGVRYYQEQAIINRR